MTAAVLDNRKPWISAIALLLAVTAVVVAVIALAIVPSNTTSKSPEPVVRQQPTHIVDSPAAAATRGDCRRHRFGTAC